MEPTAAPRLRNHKNEISRFFGKRTFLGCRRTSPKPLVVPSATLGPAHHNPLVKGRLQVEKCLQEPGQSFNHSDEGRLVHGLCMHPH